MPFSNDVSIAARASGVRFASIIFFVGAFTLSLAFAVPIPGKDVTNLWSLQPIQRPPIPTNVTTSPNPIDAFLAKTAAAKGLKLGPPADKMAWLRRVTLDLTGLPPSVADQEAFANDLSAGAMEKVIDRLLAHEQHGVRYARHWLDVLRYADLDENMPAAPGLYLWRDWIINALNDDLPYDQFVRAQISGNRAAKRRIISAAGHIEKVSPRPEDLFALGFLSRGAASRENADHQLAISAVETVSTAFMGMTVGCAKCHDHFYDPIKQADFYAMKALFDPLVLRPVDLATAQQVFAHGRAVEAYESRLTALVDAMRKYIAPYHDRLYEERLSMLPKDAQHAIRKPENQRSIAEQKIADDYHPILRIDPPKIKEIMPAAAVPRYDDYLRQINDLKPPEPLPTFWTVEEDPKRATETNYVFKTGDPSRPRLDQPAAPGLPFTGTQPDFREGRRETFVDWLTAPGNPLLARVAVNRIWQWHFGVGLHRSVSDFGVLGGAPLHPELLDWLASEFKVQNYSMKWLHRLIVSSETYRRASAVSSSLEASNHALDPANEHLWKFPLRRLEAEPVRDSLLYVAGKLDLSVGGKSFESTKTNAESPRRTIYMSRGYRSFMDVMPQFLQAFDAEDGRAPCPLRNETVTAPQALFMMNNDLVEESAVRFTQRLKDAMSVDPESAIVLAYRMALGRHPTPAERDRARRYLPTDPEGMKGVVWLLLNLDEFLYVP